MEKTRFSKLVETLREERKDALETAKELVSEDMRESLGELSVADNHPADIGTEVYLRSQAIANHDRLIHKVGAIDGAIERFEKGEYGKCEHCGVDIPLERLETLPYTTVCIECSLKEEKEEHHSFYREPVESEALMRSILRTSKDGLEELENERENAWQNVESYGTSDSAQDDRMS